MTYMYKYAIPAYVKRVLEDTLVVAIHVELPEGDTRRRITNIPRLDAPDDIKYASVMLYLTTARLLNKPHKVFNMFDGGVDMRYTLRKIVNRDI